MKIQLGSTSIVPSSGNKKRRDIKYYRNVSEDVTPPNLKPKAMPA